MTKHVCLFAKQKMQYEHTYVRVHEDGDFYDLEYYEKWNSISNYLRGNDFTIMAYTKDLDVAMANDRQRKGRFETNVLIRYSFMDDTKKEIREIIEELSIPTYECLGIDRKDKKARENFKNKNNKNKCVGDCSICKKCYQRNIENIFTLMH